MAEIQHAIQIAAARETIYPLVATAKGLGKWWAADITESSDTVDLGFFNRATVYKLRLEIDKSPAHADWACQSGDEWRGTHIIFRVEARGTGSLLRFTHAGWRAETEYFTLCNTTWGALLYRLKAAAEGKPSGPLFLANDMAN
jgi:hypothetical protein